MSFVALADRHSLAVDVDRDPVPGLIAAADYLVEHGWQQGSVGQPGGPRCAMGALKSVFGEATIVGSVNSPEYAAMRRHLDTWVSDWNDAPDRTAEEVINAFRAAAAAEAIR